MKHPGDGNESPDSEEERDLDDEDERKEYESFKAYIDKHKSNVDKKVDAHAKK